MSSVRVRPERPNDADRIREINDGGGGATPTAADGGGGGGQPTATPDSGGGIDTANGKAHYDITGAVTRSGDLGFVSVAISFGNSEMSVTGSSCTGTNATFGDSSASGTIDCPGATIIALPGTTLQTGEIKVTFDAHK